MGGFRGATTRATSRSSCRCIFHGRALVHTVVIVVVTVVIVTVVIVTVVGNSVLVIRLILRDPISYVL